MLFSRCPFEERSVNDQLKAIEGGLLTIPKFTNKISDKTEELIKRMLAPNPEERITWKELFNIYSEKKP